MSNTPAEPTATPQEERPIWTPDGTGYARFLCKYPNWGTSRPMPDGGLESIRAINGSLRTNDPDKIRFLRSMCAAEFRRGNAIVEIGADGEMLPDQGNDYALQQALLRDAVPEGLPTVTAGLIAPIDPETAVVLKRGSRRGRASDPDDAPEASTEASTETEGVNDGR